MQSLLSDRAICKISPLEFATTLCETFYTNLEQKVGSEVFPINCHHNAAVNSLSLEQQDFQYLLSGSADSSIKLWNLKAQETVGDGFDYDDDEELATDYDHPVSTFVNMATIPRKSVHKFGISCIQWWPYDTGMFISSSFDHSIRVWDTNELSPVYKFDLDSRVYSFDTCGNMSNEFSANALIAAACDMLFIKLLDLRSSSNAHMLQGHKGKTLCVKWHPQDLNLLASGGFDGEVRIWDIRRSRSCLCRLDMLRTNSGEFTMSLSNLTRDSVKAHLGPVNGLVWDPLGHILYTAGNDDKVRVWDMISSLAPPINKLINFGPLTRNKYPQTVPMALSSKYESELQYLLFPSDNGDVFVFRTIDGKLVSRLARRGTKSSGRTSSMTNGAPFSGTYFCGTMDGEIINWSPQWDHPKKSDFLDLEKVNGSSAKGGGLKDDEYHQIKASLQSDPYFNYNKTE